MSYEILNNAYWEDGCDDRSQVKCIKMFPDGNKRRKEVHLYHKINPNTKEPCHLFKEVVDKVGVQTIDKNTNERRGKKEREAREARAKHEQVKQTKELEQLFALKLQAFEVDLIKNSTERELRAKLRRSQNAVELNALATLIVGKELGVLGNERTD